MVVVFWVVLAVVVFSVVMVVVFWVVLAVVVFSVVMVVVFWVVLAVVVFSAVVAVVFLVVVVILGTLFVEAAATFLNMEKIESLEILNIRREG